MQRHANSDIAYGLLGAVTLLTDNIIQFQGPPSLDTRQCSAVLHFMEQYNGTEIDMSFIVTKVLEYISQSTTQCKTLKLLRSEPCMAHIKMYVNAQIFLCKLLVQIKHKNFFGRMSNILVSKITNTILSLMREHPMSAHVQMHCCQILKFNHLHGEFMAEEQEACIPLALKAMRVHGIHNIDLCHAACTLLSCTHFRGNYNEYKYSAVELTTWAMYIHPDMSNCGCDVLLSLSKRDKEGSKIVFMGGGMLLAQDIFQRTRKDKSLNLLNVINMMYYIILHNPEATENPEARIPFAETLQQTFDLFQNEIHESATCRLIIQACKDTRLAEVLIV